MSQADSARVEAIEAEVNKLKEHLWHLHAKVEHLEALVEGKNLTEEMYPENTAPKPGRRSG